jgi:pyruvate dehydrogenase (quinone)
LRRRGSGPTLTRPGPHGQLDPEVVFTELSPRLPDRCIISGDAGAATNWLARHLQMRSGMKFSLSGSLATMGSAVPYAIAAKFAFPDRVAIALTGDGAMQMNGLAEMITIQKYWKHWSDPRLVILVLNNRDLNKVTWETRIETGDPKFDASQDLPEFSVCEVCGMLGFVGVRVDRREDVAAGWERVLVKGDPNEFGVMPDSAKSVPAGLFRGAKAARMSARIELGLPDM